MLSSLFRLGAAGAISATAVAEAKLPAGAEGKAGAAAEAVATAGAACAFSERSAGSRCSSATGGLAGPPSNGMSRRKASANCSAVSVVAGVGGPSAAIGAAAGWCAGDGGVDELAAGFSSRSAPFSAFGVASLASVGGGSTCGRPPSSSTSFSSRLCSLELVACARLAGSLGPSSPSARGSGGLAGWLC